MFLFFSTLDVRVFPAATHPASPIAQFAFAFHSTFNLLLPQQRIPDLSGPMASHKLHYRSARIVPPLRSPASVPPQKCTQHRSALRHHEDRAILPSRIPHMDCASCGALAPLPRKGLAPTFTADKPARPPSLASTSLHCGRGYPRCSIKLARHDRRIRPSRSALPPPSCQRQMRQSGAPLLAWRRKLEQPLPWPPAKLLLPDWIVGEEAGASSAITRSTEAQDVARRLARRAVPTSHAAAGIFSP